MSTEIDTTHGGVSRRSLVAGAAVAVAATTVGVGVGRATQGSPSLSGASSYDLRGGDHQSGIVTPAQDRLHFAAFDVTTTSRAALIGLLKAWTDAADALMRGDDIGDGAVGGPLNLPPDDTGEAHGLDPAGLTITFGFGPGLFRTADGVDRFGLADRQPSALRDLPHFPGDLLIPARSGGDLCIQACSDDPQIAVHAIRNLTRIAFGTAALRWSQLGFGRTSSTTSAQVTPRNLFGFKDGTANIKADEGADLADHVWVGEGDDPNASWLVGGSYLAARRIRMTIEVWDRQPLGDQEAFIGRDKDAGAPLTGGNEFTEPDFNAMRGGAPVMPLDSHVRVVHPEFNGGARLLRRGYNFVDGNDDLGALDAGLFFLAYFRDPRTHFIPMQNKMSTNDALMEYLKFTSSALFAVPPGIGTGEYVGQALFA